MNDIKWYGKKLLGTGRSGGYSNPSEERGI